MANDARQCHSRDTRVKKAYVSLQLCRDGICERADRLLAGEGVLVDGEVRIKGLFRLLSSGRKADPITRR
jgi:hypothetical protein